MMKKEVDQDLMRLWTEWIEIPVTDIARAKVFYESVFQSEAEIHDFGNFQMAVFPHSTVGMALVQGSEYRPGTEGPLVYLNAIPDLAAYAQRITDSGGNIILPKRQISPEHGYMALFIDSEGNRLALHSYE